MTRIILAAALLAACDSPTPGVMRWMKATEAVGGMTFGVHWTAESAEAYRTSRHFRPHLSEVRANARVAIERASGCKVTSVDGDQAIVTASLACPG